MTNNVLWLVIGLTALSMVAGCTGSRSGDASSRLDDAIGLFIAGEYDVAAPDFVRLTGELSDDEQLQTAYLYLGRSYLELGEYSRALEAFSNGQLIGGGVQFDAYIAEAQSHLGTTSRLLRALDSVNRQQLSEMVRELFLSDRDGLPDDAPEAVVEAGLMENLPDGEFHAQTPVTRASFFFVMQRCAAQAVNGDTAMSRAYPQGFRSALAAGDTWIGGEEAYLALAALKDRAGR